MARTVRHRNDTAHVGTWKTSVRVATTATVTIATALNAGDVLNGVTLAANDRVLVKNQTAPAENGIYVAGVTPARAPDFSVGTDAPGALVVVEEGTTLADTIWYLTTNAPVTIGSTSLSFLQFRTLSDATPATAFQEFGGAGAGTSLNVSRADHQHNAGFFSGLVGGDSAPGDVAATGTAGSVPRRDHKHGRESYGLVGDIVAEAFGDTASAGALTKVANAAHRHAMPANPVTAHEAAGDPHTGYVTEASAEWVDLTDGGATTLHTHAGGAHTHVDSETPAGTIDGVNAAFTLAATPSAGTLHLYKNGLRQRAGAGNDYTLATNTITYEAGSEPLTGDSHVCDYLV